MILNPHEYSQYIARGHFQVFPIEERYFIQNEEIIIDLFTEYRWIFLTYICERLEIDIFVKKELVKKKLKHFHMPTFDDLNNFYISQKEITETKTDDIFKTQRTWCLFNSEYQIFHCDGKKLITDPNNDGYLGGIYLVNKSI